MFFLYKLICQYDILQNRFKAGQFMNLKDACPNELKQIDVSSLKPIILIEASNFIPVVLQWAELVIVSASVQKIMSM